MNANHANCEYLIKMTNFVNVSNSKKTKYIVGKSGKHVFFLFNHSGRLDIEIKSRDAEVFIYGIYLLTQQLYMGGMAAVGLMVLAFSYAFNEHIKYFQMKQRRLKFVFKDWLKFTFRGK